MRSLFIAAFTALILGGCRQSFDLLKTTASRVCTTVTSLANPLTVKGFDKERVEVKANKQKEYIGDDLPICKFAWDTKMMFW